MSETTPDLATPAGILAVHPQHLPPPTNLVPLSGGNTNFVWRAILSTPLPDGARTLVIKHAEPFSATNKEFHIDDVRMHGEHYALSLFAKDGPFASLASSFSGGCTITVPTVYHYNAASKILYISDFGSNVTLKQFLIDPNFASRHHDVPRLLALGTAFGTFLRSLHTMGRNHLNVHPADLQEKLDVIPKQQLIKSVYYDQYRNVVMTKLGMDDMTKAVEAVEAFAGSAEFNALDTFVMGDFWPGNVLLNSDSLAEALVVDWEMARVGVPTLDASQFCAELYMADKFKGASGAKELLKGFGQGYGIDNLNLRTFAIGLAMHVAVVGTNYGWEDDKEKMRKVVREAAVFAEKAEDADFVRKIFE